jgi:hypothetical protein
MARSHSLLLARRMAGSGLVIRRGYVHSAAGGGLLLLVPPPPRQPTPSPARVHLLLSASQRQRPVRRSRPLRLHLTNTDKEEEHGQRLAFVQQLQEHERQALVSSIVELRHQPR